MKKHLSLLAAVAALCVIPYNTLRAETNINVTVTNVVELTDGAVSVDLAGVLNARPELIRLNIDGTNGVQEAFSRFAKPFWIEKVIVASALPTNGTVIVRRVRSGVTETIATLTNVAGTVTGSISTPTYLYASDYLQANAASVGTATNAIVELHGWRFN